MDNTNANGADLTRLRAFAARAVWVAYDSKRFPNTPLRHLRRVGMALEVNINGRYIDALRRTVDQ